jgi:hypothetical protein
LNLALRPHIIYQWIARLAFNGLIKVGIHAFGKIGQKAFGKAAMGKYLNVFGIDKGRTVIIQHRSFVIASASPLMFAADKVGLVITSR